MHKLPTLLLTLTLLPIVFSREIYFPRVGISSTFYRRSFDDIPTPLPDPGLGVGDANIGVDQPHVNDGVYFHDVPHPNSNYLPVNKHGAWYQPSYGVVGAGPGGAAGVGGVNQNQNQRRGDGNGNGNGEDRPIHHAKPNHFHNHVWQRMGQKLSDVAHLKGKIHARSNEGDVVSEPTPVSGAGNEGDQVYGEANAGGSDASSGSGSVVDAAAAYVNDAGEAAMQFPVLKEIFDGVEKVVGQE